MDLNKIKEYAKGYEKDMTAYVFTMFCCILYISEYQLQVSVAQAAIED